MKILMTGATGFLGKTLARELVREGHSLVVLSRNAEAAKRKLPVAAEAFDWNPTAERAPAEAFRGVDAVISLAGEAIADKRWTKTQKQAIHDSRALGTQHLAETIATLANKPKVFVSASAIGYYGDRGEETLTESSAPGSDFLAGVCRDWERAAAGVPAERSVFIRIGIVLGQGGGMLKKVLPIFKLGLGGPLGNGRQYMSWIHVDDLASLFLHALKTSSVRGPVNGVSPEPVPNAEFTKALGHALSRPAFLPAPAFALKLALGELSTLLLGSQKVLPEAALTSGFRFRYPRLPAALDAIVKAPDPLRRPVEVGSR